jgi:hypothetical protein
MTMLMRKLDGQKKNDTPRTSQVTQRIQERCGSSEG